MKLRRILLIGLVLAASLAYSPKASALTVYAEDFEDEAVLDTSPTGSFYSYSTSGGGSAFVANDQAKFGTKSFKKGNGIQAVFEISSSPDLEPCLTPGAYYDLWFRIDDAVNAAGQIIQLSDNNNDGDNGIVDIEIVSAGQIRAEVNANGAASVANLIAFSADTWYNLIIRPTCSEAKMVFEFPEQLQAFTVDAAGSFTDLDFFRLGLTSSDMWLDNFNLTSADPSPAQPTAIGSAATVGVSDLHGFEVDPTGTSLIARVGTGVSEGVSAHSPITLALIGTDTTDCGAAAERVAAFFDYVAYLDCDDGNPKFLKIRTSTLSTPTYDGSGCGNTDVCLSDVDLEGAALCSDDELGLDDVLRNLRSSEHAPIDYSFISGPSLLVEDEDSHAFAMAFTTLDGRYGVFAYTAQDNECDDFEVATHNVGTGSAITGLCTWQRAGTNYMTVAAAGITPRILTYSFSVNSDSVLVPALGAPVSYSAYAGAKSVSCPTNNAVEGDMVAFGIDNSVKVIDIDTGTEVYSASAHTDMNNGVSLAGGQDWLAYRSSSTLVSIANLDTSTVNATLTIPSGTYWGVRLGYNGAQTWIATTTTIARFATTTVTGSGCDGPTCNPSLPTAPAAAEPDLFPDGDDVIPGTTTFFGNLFLAVMLTAMTAGAGAAAMARLKAGLLGAIIGLIAGFMLSWALNFLSTEAVVTIVVLAVLAIIAFIFWHRG